MTIRHRITLLVVLMFVALSVIGGYAVYQTRGSATEVRKVTEGVVPSALASADLVSQVKDVQLAIMTLVYAPDANMVSQAQDELGKKKTSLQQALAVQANDAASHAQKGLVAQANESLGNYFAAIADTAKMKAEGKNELAQAYLFANVAQYRDELEGIVETLRVEKNREKDDAIAALNATLATTATAIALVTGVAIVLLTLIGAMLYRQITRPLSRMQAMMSEIAASQDFTRRVPVGRLDEIGRSIVAFNGMIGKIEASSAQLKQKTADIQAMLQNMQQGILTVIDGGVIHAEYSAYLEDIFETQEIAGRDLIELVLSDTDLGSDTRAQVEAAVHACLGEDCINFAFNQHVLVNEIAKRMPDGRVKVLDLNWSAITDENDTIVRLMLCVRDVTELRKLAAQASEQRRRLDMIGEILAVGEEKFHHFIESSAGFVSENERIIRKHSEADHSAIAALFRNMHTIKGNARTYNLQHLTSVVHETEQSYHALRQPDADRQWDQAHLIEELTRVRDAIESYAQINEQSLGRKGRPGTPLARETRFVMVERDTIEHTLALLDDTPAPEAPALQSLHDRLRLTLRSMGSDSVQDALSSVLESLPSLAAELGKAPPRVLIADHGYRLRNDACAILHDVFMHLLRNSLDHGIETADARSAQGKPATGTIAIEVDVAAGALQLKLRDDGRGLALARIRHIAMERGWIGADEAVGDEAIAEFIFRPGFSTAETVTEVSGRGVGMDAVRDFLKRAHGHIELRLTDDRPGAPFRQFETIVRLPESVAVDTLDRAARAASAANNASQLDAMVD
ncbi:HAMP domain-containing protein [Paraburkholderia sp. BCC1886]|uniref:HAMP domain-containing protein n=1 Tax=Paraburkholderia sp. BCC1886 TaxID=2562670 RepID=UPI001182486E|nr:HAMP domain-containing protein [Paraburkholderia sp. BCC1886]